MHTTTARCQGRLNGQPVAATVCLQKADHPGHPAEQAARPYLTSADQLVNLPATVRAMVGYTYNDGRDWMFEIEDTRRDAALARMSALAQPGRRFLVAVLD